MKKIFLKSLIVISSTALFFLVVVSNVYASQIIINPTSKTADLGEQFFIDISIETEKESINGIEGKIIFPTDKISFIRAEYGTSIINTWIESPVFQNNEIYFSGIIPNGFDGLIDPFNPNQPLPGKVVRLIFEGSNPGSGLVTTAQVSVTKNDGMGTIINLSPVISNIQITNKENKVVYKTTDNQKPELTAEVVRDKNLFNNKYTLIFRADDKETGIKNIMITEGSGDWKEVQSPYLLKDQSRRSIIRVQAFDFAGNSTIVNIEPEARNNIYIIVIIGLVFGFVTYFVFRKKYAHKK